MSNQKQWWEFHLCDVCMKKFDSSDHMPFTLVCGHTFCKKCLSRLKNRPCPHDKGVQIPDLSDLVNIPANHAILELLDENGVEISAPVIEALEANGDDLQYFKRAKYHMEELAMFLKPLYTNGVHAINTTHLTRPMVKKLVTIVNSQLVELEGRTRVMRTTRSLAERTITELLIIQQGEQQLSHQLWAAIKSRGCQFLGPVMQEETLKYIQKVLVSGQALSRKNIVLYVVEQLGDQFPQASRTSVGHVVQLLYRSSCFNVDKKDGDSSLMQLKEEYRNRDALRKEHDTQIVKIAMEAGLRIGPEQWSSMLYGDQKHKSHMQSIIDKLIAMGCTSSGVNELVTALERSQDPYNLSEMVPSLEDLLNKKLDCSKDSNDKGLIFSLEACACSLELLVQVINRFVIYMKVLGSKYKTAMCRDISQTGKCPRGDSCTYAHSPEELERHRVLNQQSRGKKISLSDNTTNNKTRIPKASMDYNKSPVTQSYQPRFPYNEPVVIGHSPDYDHHVHQYSGEQYVSRGAPTKPSPPSTSTYSDLPATGGYRSRGTDLHDVYSSTGKYEVYKGTNPTAGGGYGSYEFYQQQQQQTASMLSDMRRKRENIIKQVEEQSDGQRMLEMSDLQDDDLFEHKATSLPNEGYMDLENSGTSDAEADVGFINKTRSFPDLSKDPYAQQQAMAIQMARLQKREEAVKKKERDLQFQQNKPSLRGYPQQYSGEQLFYGGSYNNWSGPMAYAGPQHTQGSHGTYVYHQNEQQWNRPHGNLSQNVTRIHEPATAVLLPTPAHHGYDPTQDDSVIAHLVANLEQQKLHFGSAYGPVTPIPATSITGYSSSLAPTNYPTTIYGNSGYTHAQKFQ